MKKILFIHHATGWGGAPINLIENIKALDKNTYVPHVLLIRDSIVSQKLEENNISYSIAQSVFYKRFYRYFTHSEASYIHFYQIIKFLKLSICWILSRYIFASKELTRFNYDIVQVNSSVLSDWLKPCGKKGKVIYHIQEPFRKGNLDLLYHFFRYQVKQYADHIIAISNDNAQRINIPEKTTVIYNYANIPANAPPINSYASKKVLYIGGDAKIKGFYTLVEALQYLDKDITVYFGGSYSLAKKSKNPIKQFIKWTIRHGQKKRNAIRKMRKHPNAIELGLIQDVDKYLDEICCLVSPFSAPHFSRPVIEAHLHKKPAIGSDVQGMDEIIEHNVTGLLFSKNNPKALARAINKLAQQPKKTKTMGVNGYNIAINKFSPNNIHAFQQVYNKIVNV